MSRPPLKEGKKGTDPLFGKEAHEIALAFAQCTPDELRRLLHLPPKLANENFYRYQNFHSTDTVAQPALKAYTGIVFKTLNPNDFTEAEIAYAQERLRITSFVYGLLRPLDKIKPYRAEGNIALPEWGDIPLFDYWRPKLTPYLLQEIEARGGILFNLASDEMRRLFDWKTVETQARIITPQFQVRHNDGWKTIVIYTKMARGALTRYLLKNKIENPEQLQVFEWEGFRFNELRSDNYNYIFTHE